MLVLKEEKIESPDRTKNEMHSPRCTQLWPAHQRASVRQFSPRSYIIKMGKGGVLGGLATFCVDF